MVFSLFILFVPVIHLSANQSHDGWSPKILRQEISPHFSVKESGGPDGLGSLIITQDGEGENGAWVKTFPVTGGKTYTLSVFRQTRNVSYIRRNTYAELMFTDEEGELVLDDRTGIKSRPFYPPDREINENNWTRMSDTYRAPLNAIYAKVELRLRWSPGGEVEYDKISFDETESVKPRNVRLAAVHYYPSNGSSPMDNCRQFAPLIAEAAGQRADLIVLGECVTIIGNKYNFESAAEPVPGPSTAYFGELAKKHNLYIVVGLYEREGPFIYNTAALIDPQGGLAGKYRKVCPARDELRAGVMSGSTYPVFETSFGKLGIMICFDVFVPEVARNIAANGAEIIALPIWGGDPALARARAIENQIILVTSSYSKQKQWMKTGVWDREGNLVATTEKNGTVCIHEVDLNHRHIRPYNLGDMRNRIPRERPINPIEK
ncbi:hypothetical protein BVY01_02245 [bacterium I07]|nr:hypothetical protein BVY01_02245 [bacterium I07]